MTQPIYPFSAIVGQEEMKLALLLAAVDWRIGVLLRGDKGAGKTTAARSLAALLPQPSPFINLPIGVTEDRLLGGLHLESAIKGEPALKPGLISEAHGGVLYVDEVNLLPAHLGDALLDAAASGVNVIEREGFSASHAAEFVLLGSMNPEEGTLRPQLLDRFALAVEIAAPLDAPTRQTVVERRIAFEKSPAYFGTEWFQREEQLRTQISDARNKHASVTCSREILSRISESICEAGVRSLRADLAVVRAAVAYAALLDDSHVSGDHVSAVLPLVLAHRRHDRGTPPAPRSQPSTRKPEEQTQAESAESEDRAPSGAASRIFSPKLIETIGLRSNFDNSSKTGVNVATAFARPGRVVGTRKSETPLELDARASLTHALIETGHVQLRTSNLHERVRNSSNGTRYLFVIDSSGSHGMQERMRLVKGAISGLLERSFKTGDEVSMIAFRGTAAQVLFEPSNSLQDAAATLEYLPTGGRTPLAHGLQLARSFVTSSTVLILLTDGRANVPLGSGDAWQDALEVASQIKSAALVVDTDCSSNRTGRSRALAEALGGTYMELNSHEFKNNAFVALQRLPATSQALR